MSGQRRRGVVGRLRRRHDLDLATGGHHRCARELEHRDLDRVAEVDRRVERLGARHREAALDQIADVAERARLRAVAVERDRRATQRLDEEVRDHAAIAHGHPRSVRVEDADDPRIDAMAAPRVDEDRLGHPLALVVAGALADRVDVAGVVLGLRMDERIAVDLGGARVDDAAAARPRVLDEAQRAEGRSRSPSRTDLAW